MTKQNKDGWIRHRGGKCPVEVGVKVDIRTRNGERWERQDPEKNCEWAHDKGDYNIVAYRVCEPVARVQTCEPHESLAGGNITLGGLPLASFEGSGVSINDPRYMRDRITQIDFDIKFEQERHISSMACMDQERTDLVAKLAAEGFALIAPVVVPVEDMSDWRNWSAGDLLRCVDGGSGVETGQIYQYTGRNETGQDYVVIWVESNEKGCFASRFKFHSRPPN